MSFNQQTKFLCLAQVAAATMVAVQFFALHSARAQTAVQAAPTAAAVVLPQSSANSAWAPTCKAPAELARFERPLVHTMRRLANGHVILVFNNQDNARTPLHIALSTDEARTWLDPLILETNPGEYSYPSVLQTSDGKIHIIYTFRRYSIKHVEMNEDWLVRMTRPN